jgi:hypothetical protein
MADKPDHSARGAKAKGGTNPDQFVVPIIIGLVLGVLSFAGYIWKSSSDEHHAALVAPGDPSLDKPSAAECAIAQAALTAIHKAGSDTAWQTAAAVKTMSLKAHSQIVNPVDVKGFTDPEADDLRAKSPADWRWCPGMGAFVATLGWVPIDADEDQPELALGRPAMDPANGNEAKVYEAFMAPTDAGSLHMVRGPWLVTLTRAASGAWSVASTADVPRPSH